MKNKIIEIDFYELIKIVVSGIWVIALFAVLGILISYIYVTNSDDERRFGITIPLAELKKNDIGIIEEINDNLKNLFNHQFEKNLTQYPETRTSQNNQFLDTIDETIITSLQVAKSDGKYENYFTVKDIQNMIFDSVRDVKIHKEVLRDYNKHIKENFGENDFRIIIKVDHESKIAEGQGVLNTIYFNKQYDRDIANIYANIFLNLIHIDVNKKLNVFYKRAKDRYLYEIEYLRANTEAVVDSLTNEYELYLNNAVERIKFQRELAIELKYSLPQPSNTNNLDAFSFLNGYRYLDKVLIELEKKMQEDFTQVIPELRFFTTTLEGLDKNVTLNRVEKRMKKLGLLDSNINLFSLNADSSSGGVSKLRLYEKSNAFLVIYGGIFGLLVGILFSFILYFVRNQKEIS